MEQSTEDLTRLVAQQNEALQLLLGVVSEISAVAYADLGRAERILQEVERELNL